MALGDSQVDNINRARGNIKHSAGVAATDGNLRIGWTQDGQIPPDQELPAGQAGTPQIGPGVGGGKQSNEIMSFPNGPY